jgi:hypothetical protein
VVGENEPPQTERSNVVHVAVGRTFCRHVFIARF